MPDIHLVNNSGLLFKDFGKHFLEEKTADVVFLVEGQKLPAHRLMLASHCEYFETLLYEKAFKEAREFEVELKETGVSSFKVLLEYFYTGNLNLESFDIEVVLEILELSQRYGLKTLKSQVVQFLELKVSKSNVLWLLEVAVTLELEDLENNCWWVLAMAVEEIYDRDILCQLDSQYFRKFLEFCSDKVSASKLFSIAMLLIEKNSEHPDTQQKMQLDVKALVNFSKMSADDLYGQVLKSNIFGFEEFTSLTKQLNEEGWIDKALKVPNRNLLEEPHCPKFVKGLPEVLDLGRKMVINNIKLNAFTISGDCYKIEVSTDLENWITVFEPLAPCFNRLNIFFSEIGARYIKVSGPTISEEILKKAYDKIEAYFIPNPPAQVAGYIWPNEISLSPSYFFNIVNAEKRLVFRGNILNIATENESTPFISQKIFHQLSEEGCFRIRFGQPYLTSSFRLRLWDFDGRKYSYNVIIESVYPFKIATVSDKSEELVGGWQTVTFSPRPITRISIHCNKSTIGDDFRLAYFEIPAKPGPSTQH